MAVLALLHPVQQVGWTGWSIHPSTVIGILALGGIYFWRANAIERREPGAAPASRRSSLAPTTLQRTWFLLGLLTMFLSLNGPLHDLSDYYLFSAHMVQHLLLTLVVPPLLLLGVTGEMLRPLIRRAAVARLARLVTRPAACFTIFNVVLAGWHIPELYNLAMANHDVHIVEHLMFMASAVVMWWPYLSPLPELPRLSYPGQILYSFLMTLPMSVVAIYVTMANHVLYPAYASAPRVWELSPLEDQTSGGLIMWIPGSMFFYVVMSVVFFRWQQRQEDSTAGAQVDWSPAA